MRKWEARLISGLAIAAGFYSSADLESRNNRLFQAKKALEATQQNYDTVNEYTSETAHLVITNKGGDISR
jgi:hypothetical protein